MLAAKPEPTLDGTITRVWSLQVMEKLPTFAPHMEAVELTNALWACAKLEVAADGVFEELSPVLIKQCAIARRAACCASPGELCSCILVRILCSW
jgi:hypothetical protein